jgi:hypothetical protein
MHNLLGHATFGRVHYFNINDSFAAAAHIKVCSLFPSNYLATQPLLRT